MNTDEKFDVIIAGAGPAGIACALEMAKSGISIAVFDNAVFPRDKVCGDAIGGRVKTVLGKIHADYPLRLENFTEKSVSTGWRLVSPAGRAVEVEFTTAGYVSKRKNFDHFLFGLAI